MAIYLGKQKIAGIGNVYNNNTTPDSTPSISQVVHIGNTAPEETKLLWIDTRANIGGLKYYDGTNWIHVPVAYT